MTERVISFSRVKGIVRGERFDGIATTLGRAAENNLRDRFVKGTAPRELQKLRLESVAKRKHTLSARLPFMDFAATCTPDLVTADSGKQLVRCIEIKLRGSPVPDDRVQAAFAMFTGPTYAESWSGGLFGTAWNFEYWFYYHNSGRSIQTEPGFLGEAGIPFLMMCEAAANYLLTVDDRYLENLSLGYLTIAGENY